jgi:hypothetical protein
MAWRSSFALIFILVGGGVLAIRWYRYLTYMRHVRGEADRLFGESSLDARRFVSGAKHALPLARQFNLILTAMYLLAVVRWLIR